jgi:hypothetical protein
MLWVRPPPRDPPPPPSSIGTTTVSRGHSIVFNCPLKCQLLFKVEQLGVDISNGKSFLSEKGGDDGIVLLIKASKDVRD